MNIGIVCYASIGGSGIVATELAKQLARRGHRIHILSSDTPVRLGDYLPGLSFHRVEPPSYPLFREPQYLLSLANKIVHVARDERLDIVHAHYAIPHATAAYLARQILAASPEGGVPKIITTLHGTDITLLGGDASYKQIVAFSIEQSDGVTTVSESLKADTTRELGVHRDIRVIPNFIDVEKHRRVNADALRCQLASKGEKLVIHVSNFRPVKRVMAAVEIFASVVSRVPAKLLLVGDGPDQSHAIDLARALGIADRVVFLGEHDRLVPLLSASDVFLLPSAQESFGLAALEAMACALPVVASRVGGLSELVDDGVSGFLHPPDDLAAMAESVCRLLTDAALYRAASAAARQTAEERFKDTIVVPRYEAYYEEVLAAPAASLR
ncbi:MAG: N-acetyl-alpha-D-glucosaminyl L-malate synthase BshA [Acidobacteriaceae bacterium]|nr:N-acetyl-alpha-D-glucosaminyl L-malate synthase BshA [Acidobacteriaceae bacterium]